MKKILLIGYMKENLGDDLFLSLIINRYKKYEIDVYCQKKFIEPFIKARHVKFIDEEFFKNENIDLNKYAVCIFVGGSIFKESKYDFELKKWLLELELNCKKKDIPFYFVSSNFGPYQTKDYFNLVEEIIKNCTKIYFREEYSKNLFKFKNVLYNPDLVFSMNFNNKKQIKNTVGISLINLYSISRGKIDKYYFEYMRFLKNNIINYIKDGKTVYLYSFCEYEGDLDAVKTLLSMMKYKYSRKIKVVHYNGDITKFLNIYSRMEYMLCTRFHAMILSAYFNQKLIVCNYSNKISNVIKDYKFDCEYIQIDQDIENRIIKLNEYKKCKTTGFKEKAELSYVDIDKYLTDMFNLPINSDALVGGTYKVYKKSKIKRLVGKVLRKLKIKKGKKKVIKEKNIIESNNYILNKNLGLSKLDNNTFNECKRLLGYEYESTKIKSITKGPLVSFILKGEQNDTVDSILNQSYKNIEIIANKKLLDKKYKDNKLIKSGEPNGEYIVYCENDIYTDLMFIEKAINKFKEDENINFVSYNSFNYDGNEIKTNKVGYNGLCNCLDYIVSFQIEYHKPNISFTMFKKDAFKINITDQLMFLNAMKSEKMIMVDEYVGFHRQTKSLKKSLNDVIDNLKGIKKIYLYLKDNNLIDNPDFWFYQQVKLNTKDYVKNSKPGLRDFNKLMKWNSKNLGIKRMKLFMDMFRIQFRRLM